MAALLWFILGYLSGSILHAYIAARLVKGIDIRQYGSGNVGGSNAVHHVGLVPGTLAGLMDAVKALIPAWAAMAITGRPELSAAAGMGAVAGHCWSLYLSFTGGRGMAPTAGALLPIFPAGIVWIVVVHLAGSALRLAPLADLVALITLPFLATLFARHDVAVSQAVVILLIVAAKRLHANGIPLPRDKRHRREVLVRRLLFDRDVRPGEPWVERKPLTDK